MDHFNYIDGRLHAEEVSLAQIAETHGTPCYVYSRATLERHWHAFNDAFEGHPHLVCYAVKANSNLAVLNLFARLGSGQQTLERLEYRVSVKVDFRGFMPTQRIEETGIIGEPRGT